MSNKEFYGVWEKEAEAVVAALKAGEIKTLYKVPGTLVWVQRALMECES
jgi:hypothetical protein